jgi:hypothetical protein
VDGSASRRLRRSLPSRLQRSKIGRSATPAAIPTKMAEPTTPARAPITCIIRSAAGSPARYCHEPSCGPSSQPDPSPEFRRLVSSHTGWFGRLQVGNAEIQPYRPASSSNPWGRPQRSEVALIHWFNLRDTGRNFHFCSTAVFCKQRSTSATLQAWAMQPRGVNGGSASKTSLIEPIPASARCGSKPSRKCRAIARSSG